MEMEYADSDSSGTDDDLPPSSNRLQKVRATVGSKSAVQYGGPQMDMEPQIHNLEKDAYSAVLRAFNAQSDSISWAKEGLITDLRKELRVSDEEHRELLAIVNADSIIRQLREWRQKGSHHPLYLSNAPSAPSCADSPTLSAPQKKQKTSHGHLQFSGHNLKHLPAPSTSMPYASFSKQEPLGPKSKKSKLVEHGLSITGPEQMTHKRSMGWPSGKGHSTSDNGGSLIHRNVLMRWPQDNSFYQAVIADFNPESGEHLLVYGMNTPEETHEWVNMKAISPSDIRWCDHPPSGSGQGAKAKVKKPRGVMKAHSTVDAALPQNGRSKRVDIELRVTEILIKEVEKIVGATYPDPEEVEKAKKILKEHELSLLDALERISEVCDEEPNPPSSRTHSVDCGRIKNKQFNKCRNNPRNNYDTEDDGQEESAGGPFIEEGGIASDNMQEEYDTNRYV